MPTAPASKDLHLENLKPGDKVTTVTIKKGRIVVSRSVSVILDFYEKSGRWRYGKHAGAPVSGAFPPSGKGYQFMQKKDTPPAFYYSANPKHIAQAEKKMEKARIAREEKQKERARLIAIAHPIGLELGDDNENCDSITETLVDKLSEEQIVTLKSWLT